MLTVDLHPYQKPAVEMLLIRQNLLIAMDMGLGKTITSIAAAEHLLGIGEVSTVLVCAPSGLLYQWAQAIAANTDVDTMLRKARSEVLSVPTQEWCVVIDGTPAKKRRLIEQVKAQPPQYIVASYDTVASFVPLFSRLAQMVVIDEVTVLKGFSSARSKALCGLDVRWRIGLTGTPVENHRPEEAWGIMRWLDPDLFGSFRIFEAAYIRRNRYGRPVRYVNLDVLHELLSTAMYRKRATDPDVADFLPSVKKTRIAVNLDARTRVVYVRILADLRERLQELGTGAEWDVDAYYGGTDESSGAGRVAAVQLAAVMLLDHPEVLRASARERLEGEKTGRNSGSEYAASLVASGALEGLNTAPKLAALSRKVTKIFDKHPNSKLIITARFRLLLDLFEQILSRWKLVRYSGEMSRVAKASAVSSFERDPHVRLLIMTHAGAYGVDLPSATHLINYSRPRSSGMGRQMNARPVRVSSVHPTVNVIDLVVTDSLDEWSEESLSLKDRVASAITDGDGVTETGVIKNSLKPLTRHVADALGDTS